MALEPMVVTLDSGPNPELVDMQRRFWIAEIAQDPTDLLANISLLVFSRLPVKHGLRLGALIEQCDKCIKRLSLIFR